MYFLTYKPNIPIPWVAWQHEIHFPIYLRSCCQGSPIVFMRAQRSIQQTRKWHNGPRTRMYHICIYNCGYVICQGEILDSIVLCRECVSIQWLMGGRTLQLLCQQRQFTTLSYAFTLMKRLAFRLTTHRNVYPGFDLKICQHWFR